MTKRSQCQAISEPAPKTWDDYERGCLSTFHGGLEGTRLKSFQHGMQTVFNLLRGEFPSAERCRENAELADAVRELREACKVVADWLGSFSMP